MNAIQILRRNSPNGSMRGMTNEMAIESAKAVLLLQDSDMKQKEIAQEAFGSPDKSTLVSDLLSLSRLPSKILDKTRNNQLNWYNEAVHIARRAKTASHIDGRIRAIRLTRIYLRKYTKTNGERDHKILKNVVHCENLIKEEIKNEEYIISLLSNNLLTLENAAKILSDEKYGTCKQCKELIEETLNEFAKNDIISWNYDDDEKITVVHVNGESHQ